LSTDNSEAADELSSGASPKVSSKSRHRARSNTTSGLTHTEDLAVSDALPPQSSPTDGSNEDDSTGTTRSSSADDTALRRYSITGADSDAIKRELEAQPLVARRASINTLKRMMGKSNIEMGFIVEFKRISNVPPLASEGTHWVQAACSTGDRTVVHPRPTELIACCAQGHCL
jgi:hypothetical protein